MIEIDLTRSVVVITGAAGGIGRGITEGFAAAGASLFWQPHRRGAPTTMTPFETLQLDLTAKGAADLLLAEAIARFGRVDAVVDNAGVQPAAGFADITEVDWAGARRSSGAGSSRSRSGA